MQKDKQNKGPIYLIGAAIGLLVGFITAHFYLQSVDERNDGVMPKIETGDALRLGMTAITVMRQITDLGAKNGRR